MLSSNLKLVQPPNRSYKKTTKVGTHWLSIKLKIILAFGSIYLIWGSTYLAIRFAIETIPPFFMMGCRSLLAGGVLYAWARWRGVERPQLMHWVWATFIGVLLFLGGHGALAWSEQILPSGIAALIVATNPIWMTTLQAFRLHNNPLTSRVIFGLAIGLGGVFLLVEPTKLLNGLPVDPIGAVVLTLGTLSWAVGSVYSKNAELPKSSILVAGMTQLCGGGALLFVSLLSRETLSLSSISVRSFGSMLYLIVFGSISALTAYIWLLKKTTPTRVSTHAYVNPIVALFVGWLAGGELLSQRILFAALLMLIGVAAILSQNSTRRIPVRKQQSATGISLNNPSKEQ
jgi:drug/metabolite transporter (DMT)-like permease